MKTRPILFSAPNFEAWSPATLAQFARDAYEEMARLREDNKALLRAWREAVLRAPEEAQPSPKLADMELRRRQTRKIFAKGPAP